MDPIIQALLDTPLTNAQLRRQNKLCTAHQALLNRVLPPGRWQGIISKSLEMLLSGERIDPDKKKAILAMLSWVNSTMDYFAKKSGEIMAAESRGEVLNINWDWDKFLLTYPDYTLWDLTETKVENYILPATGYHD
jgi:hypothetical protein